MKSLNSGPAASRVAFCLAVILLAQFHSGAADGGKARLDDQGQFALYSCDEARFKFGGVLGARIDANADNWLLRAPQANPGMLEMFRVRDRQPVPNLVPWAGEFVGKYLISAIQALRMSDNPALHQQVSNIVAELIATQAEDGYLGPFPKAVRLRGNWDLWGHYHVLRALMLWYEETGDTTSLAACRRATDLVCQTFLDAPQRVYDAGSHEMNMAVIHGLGQLHRHTGEARYLRMMREIEKDWERAGDYLRSGLSGAEFFQSPRPRWESLHDLQGLVELYRITGDARYRQAFEHHWRSIARWDRHNTGGFSSGEQATGNAYSPAAIETCCTVAWMALTVDMLRLTGDPLCADELELSTCNGGVGAQHPSGRWWTYSTPMDGMREASAHSIVFQSRAGTPELNCCSVNAPRVLGMLAEWAVMTDDAGLVVNYYGPGSFHDKLRDGTPITLRWETDYPRSGRIRIRLEPMTASTFRVKFRVPAWVAHATAVVNNGAKSDLVSGSYFAVSQRWARNSAVELDFDMGPRFVTGDRESAGKVSLYRGPLLLAYDQRFNAFDELNIPAIDLRKLNQAAMATTETRDARPRGELNPWLLLDLPTANDRMLRLCDFASAGAAGTRYRSWLTASNCPPPPVVTRLPRDGAAIARGPTLFRWTGPARPNERVREYRLAIAESLDFSKPPITLLGLESNAVLVSEEQLRKLTPGRTNYWRVTAVNAHGFTESVRPAARFVVDPALEPGPVASAAPVPGPDGVLVRAALHGNAQPEFGKPGDSTRLEPCDGPDGMANRATRLDGKTQKISYMIEEFPGEDYSMAVWLRIDEMPSGHLGQIFSAWCAPMDDPLRVCVDKGRMFARIEAGQGYSTPGIPVETGRWHHVAAVKEGDKLTVFLDGKAGATTAAPLILNTNSREVALGGNPRFTGNEFLAASFSDFRFQARVLTADEIAALASLNAR